MAFSGFGTGRLGERIRKILSEENPLLHDFKGAKIAKERDYRSRSVSQGLAAFSEARRNNIEIFKSVSDEAWSRRGTLEGVGEISLYDMPSFLIQHDTTHKAEIEYWKKLNVK